MRAVILAAGRATRLLPLTKRTPKCLLEVGGRPIVIRAVDALVEHGVHDITIVVGFEGERVRSALRGVFPAARLSFVRNDAWASCVAEIGRPQTRRLDTPRGIRQR